MVGEAEVGGTVHGLLIGSFGSSLYSLVPLSESDQKKYVKCVVSICRKNEAIAINIKSPHSRIVKLVP